MAAKDDKLNHEFAVRLLGRIIFCWFLREKKSKEGISLISEEVLSLKAVKDNSDYYHRVLEPLFFEILNKPIESRKQKFAKKPFNSIPYLNGGLFTPHYDDFYSFNEKNQVINNSSVIIPNEWLISLFKVLELYNFTIDENIAIDIDLSIDPEMLGRIFENLLAEINPETGETARKHTGSYYTPREIVNYMIDESLYYYFKSKTCININKIKALISYNLDDDLKYPINENERLEIIETLNELKLIDPACGSGAFPIGALQKILYILQIVDPDGNLWFKQQIINVPPEIKKLIEKEFYDKNLDYIRKLGIIRNSIFGIDIQPVATEISRLRCFLTLIVDERISDNEKNRGIEPLPNLDFKFVTGNSLIGLNDTNKKEKQEGFFEDEEGIKELKILRDMFFSASGFEREQLKVKFTQTQNKILNKLITDGWGGHSNLTTQLTTWEPFTNKPSEWFDAEWMFGLKDGFDIVIGNPPYVDSEHMVQINEKLRKEYTDIYSTAKGNWDLFVIFTEKGANLLKNNGTFVFIIPNKIISARYSTELRSFLSTKTIKEIRDYSRINVFIDQDIYPITLILNNKVAIESDKTRMIAMQDLTEFSQANEVGSILFNKDIYWDRYFFEEKILNLLQKIWKNKKLKTHIKHVQSSATVSEAYKIKKYIFDDKEKKGYKLINTGTIDPYRSLWGNKKMRYIKSSYLFPQIKPESLAKINFKRDLQSKAPKIIIAGMSNKLEAFFDKKGEYCAGKSTSIILGEYNILSSLIGLINSKLLSFFITHFYHSLKMSGDCININSDIINNLPLPPDYKNSELIKHVNDLINVIDETPSADIVEIEEKINNIVYKLYNLTSEEIGIIETKFPSN